jgi:hypothetical protein
MISNRAEGDPVRLRTLAQTLRCDVPRIYSRAPSTLAALLCTRIRRRATWRREPARRTGV